MRPQNVSVKFHLQISFEAVQITDIEKITPFQEDFTH